VPDGDEAWLRIPSYLASLACVPVLYAIVRPLLGTRVALLAALGLAVAPYHVSFANYSRAFMLGQLGLLLALWAAARLAQGRPARWWGLYVLGGAIATWSTYDSWLFLAALSSALLLIGRPRRLHVLAASAVIAVLFLPWVQQARRSIDALDESKVAPRYPGPTPGGIRDKLVPLFFGEHGTAHSHALRWLQLLAIVAALGWGAAKLWQRGRLEFLLLPGVLLGLLGLHTVTAVAGPDVFAQRYLTAVIPLACATLAHAVTTSRRRAAVPVAAAALLALGAAVLATRLGRELEPDPAPVNAFWRARAGERPLLTNSAVLMYYVRGLEPRLDRPFGLGRGTDAACGPPHCRVAFAIVDDERVAGGARPGPGARHAFGPLVVRLEPTPP
jgi:hypothetical protein